MKSMNYKKIAGLISKSKKKTPAMVYIFLGGGAYTAHAFCCALGRGDGLEIRVFKDFFFGSAPISSEEINTRPTCRKKDA